MITQGKWELTNTGDIVVKDEAGWTRICHMIEHAPRWADMDKSNAALIAAAPRLLAACDYAYGLLTQRDSDTDIDKAEVIEILQGVIEAAKRVQNGHE